MVVPPTTRSSSPKQAGRFKPRKPPKKIRAGEASGAAAGMGSPAPGAVVIGNSISSSSNPSYAASAALTETAAVSAETGGIGGGGPDGVGTRAGVSSSSSLPLTSAGGQGSRGMSSYTVGGGRGRGAGQRQSMVPPIEQGQAFFQGDRGGSESGRGGRGKGRGRGQGTRIGVVHRSDGVNALQEEEIIVGVLDEAIGVGKQEDSNKSKSSGKSSSIDHATTDRDASTKVTRTAPASDLDNLYYDTESSQDSACHNDDHDDDDDIVDDIRFDQRQSSSPLKPIVLSNPHAAREKGIPSDSKSGTGSDSIIAAHNAQGAAVSASKDIDPLVAFLTSSSLASAAAAAAAASSSSSSSTSSLATEHPGDAPPKFLLVQLPTRLPPLKQQSPVTGSTKDPMNNNSDNNNNDDTMENNKNNLTLNNDDDAERVNLPYLRRDRFDNALSNAAPGKLGRIVVYESGRMEMIWEGPDGSDAVRMNVSGHECSFLQQAVSIDASDNFVTLGNVQHTMVVTPDLSSE